MRLHNKQWRGNENTIVNQLKYRDKNTIIHKLNPFCKLGWACSLVLLVLIFDNPVYIVALFLVTIPFIFAAGIQREWFSLMKISFYLCAAIIVINVLVNNNGTHVLLRAPFTLPVTGTPLVSLEAICFAAMMSLRLLAIMSVFAIVTSTIHPDDLMLSMIKVKLPYKSVLVTSLSTRFIPTLFSDIRCISDVQRSRGLELDKGNLMQKVSNRMAIIIPLLSNSLDRVVQVAEAMEARAFGSTGKRTHYKEIRFGKTDIFALLIIMCACGLGIFTGISGYGDYQYYPSLAPLDMSYREILFFCIIIFLFLSIIPIACLNRRSP
jgi:energy-coupling factor transport system permease protein